MQHRMKTHQLTKTQSEQLLKGAMTGCLATINKDGSPYVIPVHYIYHKDCIFIHGLPKGQKIDNIVRNTEVSMTVFEMNEIVRDSDNKPCDTNTSYKSVVINGSAILIADLDIKRTILMKIVEKYTPDLSNKTLPENMIKGTAVIQVTINEMTGKYY